MDEAKVIVQEIDEKELEMLQEQSKKSPAKQDTPAKEPVKSGEKNEQLKVEKSPSPDKASQSYQSPSPQHVSPEDKNQKSPSLKSQDLPQHKSEEKPDPTPEKETEEVLKEEEQQKKLEKTESPVKEEEDETPASEESPDQQKESKTAQVSDAGLEKDDNKEKAKSEVEVEAPITN